MPTVLDNFIVLFGESGAKKLEKTIDNIGKAVVNSVNKSIAAHKTLEQHRRNSIKNLTNANKLRHKLATESSKIEERTLRKTVPLGKQLVDALRNRDRLEKSISGSSKNTIKYQQKRNELAKENAKITDLEAKIRRQQSQEEERSLRRRNKIIVATAATVAMIGRSAFKEQKWAFDVRRDAARRVSAYQGTGMTARNVQGFDEYLGGFGGASGEGAQALRSLNAKIGAMRYGDTSLVQTLGTFGIGGIGAHSTPKDVLRAIMQRAQGMDAAESEAMFSAMGFDDAMKLMARKGDIEGLEREADPYKFDKKQIELLQKTYQAEEDFNKKAIEAADKLSPIESAVNFLKEKFGLYFNLFDGINLKDFINAGLLYFTAKGVFGMPKAGGRGVVGSPKLPRIPTAGNVPAGTQVEGKVFDGTNWRDAKTGQFAKAPAKVPTKPSFGSRVWGGTKTLGGRVLGVLGSTPVMVGQLLAPNVAGGGEDEITRRMELARAFRENPNLFQPFPQEISTSTNISNSNNTTTTNNYINNYGTDSVGGGSGGTTMNMETGY